MAMTTTGELTLPADRSRVWANVGGAIAQLRSRLTDGVAKEMADHFFTSFAAAVGGLAAC